MDIVTFFIPDAKATILEQPGKGGLHHPAVLTQPATMFGVALGDQRGDAAIAQRLPDLLLGIVGPIRQHHVRSLAGTPTGTGIGSIASTRGMAICES